MLDEAISALVDDLPKMTDEDIHGLVVKLDRLRRLTSGEDRELVLWAMTRCREALSAGRLVRAIEG
jgi:hypothetical protein